MIAECGHLVVVNVELVWDVDSEALLCNLEGEEKAQVSQNMFGNNRKRSAGNAKYRDNPQHGRLSFHAQLSSLSTFCS